jgi:membrane associated rhomboid family serine protease
MIALKIKCKCGKLLGVPAALAGKKVVCPGCRRAYRVPADKISATPSASNVTPSPAKSAPPPALRNEHDSIELSTADPLASPSELNLLEDIERSGTTIHLSTPTPHESVSAQSPAVPTDGRTCPACGKAFPKSAKICVQCGVDLKTGRCILMTDDSGMDEVYVRAESTLKWLSWIVPMGIYPVASEAFGTRKPHTVRSIALLTILTSIVFWAYEFGGLEKAATAKNYLLWCGDGNVTGGLVAERYLFEEGDGEAFRTKVVELVNAKKAEEPNDKEPQGNPAPQPDEVEEIDEAYAAELAFDEADEATLLAAHHALPLEKQCFGQYHAYQLLTNAFLHADLMHIAGNLLFLMVFGSRVNALVGNITSLILYPILAIAASIAYMISSQHEPPHAALGASGAIMGLAGMYFMLFPVHKVHMAAWLRWGLIGWFRLHLKLFAVRGFWVVLFYIAFDVFYTVIGAEDGVAHWAHLGGFIAGMIIALLLLVTRLVNARGGDLFTAILGRHAWALIGKPR